MNRLADIKRRRLLGAAGALLGVTWAADVVKAQALQRLILTPRQTRGPFYPVSLPLDSDNDLVTVNGRSGVAKGDIVEVYGRVIDHGGRPVRDARIEIWQCDANGRYHHPRDRGKAPLDPNFQGYGHFITGADGGYRFRTIKPVPYPGRAPHIHFAVSGAGFEPLVTQMYVAGAPENERDFLLNSISDRRQRRSLIVAFRASNWPAQAATVGEFDIVLGFNARARL